MQINYEYREKNIVITGGASGLGLAIARQYAIAGANVCVADLKIPKDIQERIGSDQGKILVFELDVTDAKAIANMIAEIEQKLGSIDAWINNASIYPTSDFLKMTEDEWDRMHEIDLKSVFLCTQSLAKHMIAKKKRGCIVNIGTIDALHPSNAHSHYCSAKAGVLSYTKSSAYELGSHGIRVNMISPGLIDRPDLKEIWPDGYQRFITKVPLKVVPKPENIAYACMFLTSDLADCITGVDFPIDSGVLCAPPY